jgi:mannosyltransferase
MQTSDILVIAPNFKRRLSGVTSTIIQLVPLQAARAGVVAFGPGLPAHVPRLPLRKLSALWRRPRGRPFRIWHARRNVEMLAGVILRDLLRMPLKLVFTSASQRRHTRWTRFLISRMDSVIATSRKTAGYLTVPHHVVMHGIDLQRFHPPVSRDAAREELGLPERRTIGCFGRIRAQKGTDLFVQAMIALLPERPQWQAIICGRATAEHRAFEARLRADVVAAGLADRILFLGEFPDVAPHYRTLDLFVAPQRWEGFGLTPLEAMACGVPVVAADVGVFADVVPPACGTIVTPDDASALMAGIAAMTDDPERLAAAAQDALAHVREHFPLEREARELAAVYEAVWQAGGSGVSRRPG